MPHIFGRCQHYGARPSWPLKAGWKPALHSRVLHRGTFALSLACILLALLSGARAVSAAPGSNDATGFHFNTMVAHWTDYADPDYLKFLDEAKPEVAQVGFYGVTFYSLAHTPFGSGYPAHLPVQGTAECGLWFENLNREIHRRGPKVVGHFNVTFIFGDPYKKAGFFEWYDKGWDEKVMGPKPCADPIEMLQKDAQGKPITTESYKIGGWPEYHGCLNNPKWRACLKAMLKQAVARGVDGLISNYFYRRDCMCEYCQAGFRDYLEKHYTAAQLRDQMGIDDIHTYKFTEIPSWHDPKTTNPYKMAALTWTQIAWKQAFDDIFINYGRSIKPDLIVAQWNHLGNFNQINGDERCALPGDLWGRGEDYLWYSTGNAASQTDLAKGDLGDGTLQLRYIRGAFGPKTFNLGKYEQTRTRASIAEGIANGGAGMGFYAPFKDPVGRQDFIQYFGFIHRNQDLYADAEPAAEMLLLYPRSAVHAGDVTPVDLFRTMGKRLVRDGYAFDILPDDLLMPERLKGYKVVAACDDKFLSPVASQAFSTFKGLRLNLATSGTPDNWRLEDSNSITRRTGSPTVVISLLKQPAQHRLLVHLVNYNRIEPPKGVSVMGRGPQDEQPVACENIQVQLQVPTGAHVKAVRLLSPDDNLPPRSLPVKRQGSTVTFTVPRILVYSVAVVDLK